MFAWVAGAAETSTPRENLFPTKPLGIQLSIKMIGPYSEEADLQIVCLFKHKPTGDTYQGAAKETDEKLGGILSALRNRGEFVGESGETFLFTPPKGSIPAKRFMVIGLGEEKDLSFDTLRVVGRIAAREAVRLKAKRVAWAPVIRDQGNPTGLLIARPNATILYATLAKGPKLPPEHQMNSTRHFMRELNRLGLTSVVDAGGGFQNYPEDYAVIEELHKRGELTLRIAYNLFTQKPKQEKEDFARWIKMTTPGKGDDFFRCNGAGEMLVFSAADFEDFLETRPELPASLEGDLKEVVSLLVANKWPFRLHATYDESITRFLNVFEEVNRGIPFKGLNWFFDHCETVSDKNLERIKALGGGIAIQHRMAYQGEYFMERYGKKAAERTPPVRKMLEIGIPVGAGTDATRVASYNPWVSLYWMVTGKTVGGVSMYPDKNRLEREEALRLYTQGSSWFSSEGGKKGALGAGQLADFVVLTQDYFFVPEEQIKTIESVLTVVGGKVVYGSGDFAPHAPSLIPVLPEWSPLQVFGGYGAPLDLKKSVRAGVSMPQLEHNADCGQHGCSHAWHQLVAAAEVARSRYPGFWGAGCDCFTF